MKAVVAAFNQEKALVGVFSVISNLRMDLFEALTDTDPRPVLPLHPDHRRGAAAGVRPHHHLHPDVPPVPLRRRPRTLHAQLPQQAQVRRQDGGTQHFEDISRRLL